jgi:hypothetical protein
VKLVVIQRSHLSTSRHRRTNSEFDWCRIHPLSSKRDENRSKRFSVPVCGLPHLAVRSPLEYRYFRAFRVHYCGANAVKSKLGRKSWICVGLQLTAVKSSNITGQYFLGVKLNISLAKRCFFTLYCSSKPRSLHHATRIIIYHQ